MIEKSDTLNIISWQDIIVNKEFLPILQNNHLSDFSSLMNYTGGQVIKRLILARSTVRFELKNGNRVVEVFLKRYHSLPMGERLKFPFSLLSPHTALKEWENILAFHRVDLPTVVPIATGMKRRGILGRESFLLTQGLEETKRLDNLLLERFSPPLSPEMLLEKKALIRHLALLTQKMHHLGFNHRDFYLCHILVRKSVSRGWEIFICDLHRAERRKKVSSRWLVKDLAALNYSAPEKLISAGDRTRFLIQYLGKARLDREARLLIEKIVKKTNKMKRHNARRKTAH